MNLARTSNSDLIDACVKGDGRAYKEVFELFSPKMMSICKRYADGYDEARDFMQEGFIRVFDNIHKFRGDSSLETWITRIMVNNAITNIRKKAKKAGFVDVADLGEDEGPESDMLDEQAQAMEIEEVLECMQKLPAGYRTVINLYAVDGKSHKEIAELLGISESTSKTQLLKARKYLKQLITLIKK
ncbi:MAG: RNA polymerase sigma factor [Bacteroidia bacterium]|nr:RNA polymerase sigma factor [Bacteroidia bacterium]